MTTEERYPNFARLTALLNQQKHPRQTLRRLVDLIGDRKEANSMTRESPG